MGIKGLFKLIAENAPDAIAELTLDDITECTLAIDASIEIYKWYSIGVSRGITNNHLQGAFFRTAKLILAGIRPIYVFDGKPPAAKLAALKARKSTPIAKEAFADVKTLLELMQVTVIQAPGEAEALCAQFVKAAQACYTATEDMDALAFGSLRMLRGWATEIDLGLVLKGLDLTYRQFVDLCILCGCDYTGTLPGIGPKRALALMQKYGSIEKILRGEKIACDSTFDYIGARREFLAQRPAPAIPKAARMTSADITRLEKFLLAKGLMANRISGTITRLKKYYE